MHGEGKWRPFDRTGVGTGFRIRASDCWRIVRRSRGVAMTIIKEEDVVSLGISPAQCVEWAKSSFLSKPRADMPPKISVHPFQDSFYTAMPCYHPDIGRVGVKVISRVVGGVPAVKSKLMLFDAPTGEMLALIDTNWVTSMRTGAVAALAAKTFASNFDRATFGFVGLGVIGKAVLRCLLSIRKTPCDIWLLKYKDQGVRFSKDFESSDVRFHVVDSREELIANTSVLFSCVTVMREQFLPADAYPSGYLCVPVHTQGFQDCDLVFDRVFGDDARQMQDWKNFSRFKEFAEFSDVLLGKSEGRRSAEERILSYNYGLGLHDLWFASRIYDMIVKG